MKTIRTLTENEKNYIDGIKSFNKKILLFILILSSISILVTLILSLFLLKETVENITNINIIMLLFSIITLPFIIYFVPIRLLKSLNGLKRKDDSVFKIAGEGKWNKNIYAIGPHSVVIDAKWVGKIVDQDWIEAEVYPLVNGKYTDFIALRINNFSIEKESKS